MSDPKDRNLTWDHSHVTPADRQGLLGQTGCVIWMTGLSGSGKSTVGRALEKALIDRGQLAFVLDGDNVRHGLNADLGFSAADRDENIRRVGQVAALFAEAGVLTIVSFISPYRAGRARAREMAGAGRFVEVFVDTPIETCRRRDPKGLYKKADAGEITDFTGIDAPYETPEAAEITLKTQDHTPEESAGQVIDYLIEKGFVCPTT
ncbi:MAG: adenylyl-sulfate kinase [Planctomycetota bacterium]